LKGEQLGALEVIKPESSSSPLSFPKTRPKFTSSAEVGRETGNLAASALAEFYFNQLGASL